MDTEVMSDKEHDINQVSSKHTSSLVAKDEHAVLEELAQKLHVLDYNPGQEHRTFSGIRPNAALSFNKDKLFSAITKYKLDLQRKANVARLCKHNFWSSNLSPYIYSSEQSLLQQHQWM